jgi:hypothetical protein
MVESTVAALAVAADAADVGGGIVGGGWEYIWAAWGLTWASLFVYGTTLFLRSRKAAKEE